jgi:Gram-negative bacterial TonB protein C-terminal
MPVRKIWALIFVGVAWTMCFASDYGAALRVRSDHMALTMRERLLWSSAVHNSNFSTMSRLVAPHRCEAAQPPEALATPDPLLDSSGLSTKVTVSFIIGIDGRVHSPLILDSLGPSEDRIVLDAVRSWRYRPATCNGVPTEAEGKIAFSSR